MSDLYSIEKMDTDQQLVIYKTLIRPCIEYVPSVQLQSKKNVKMLQIIENKALIIIYKEPPIANLETIEVRLKTLDEKYWARCKDSGNELIQTLNKHS